MRRLLATLAVTVSLLATGLPHGQITLAQDEPSWLVMLYQNADDEVLEGDIFTDLNEAELVGSSDQVTIVSQLDRYDGAFDGDGDWTTAKRFLVTADDDLSAIGSEEVEDLGEVDSGAPETLVDFAIWAMTTFPAQRYALILSDHGAGWVGGWNDNAPDEGSSLTINEIDQALGDILAQTGVAQFELLGFDACLMSQLEALAGVAPYAAYAVASEETEPAMGWAYARFLGSLVYDPAQGGRDLARTIVDSYIVDDVRVQDDAARAEYLREAYGADEDVGADELGAHESEAVTLTAVDLTQLPALMDALDVFALALSYVEPDVVDEARTYAQSFESVFGDDEPSPYLDLGNFAGLAAELARSPELDDAVGALGDAYLAAMVAEFHGEGRPGATGFTIFFPTPDLLVAVGTEDSELSYTAYASRFAGASLWDDFLAYHYAGQPIDPASTDPALLDPGTGAQADLDQYAAPLLGGETQVTGPEVASDLSIAPLEASTGQLTAGQTVTLSTQIGGGEDVGFIYIEASRFDEETDSYVIEDVDFVAADDSAAFGGINYPVWTEDDLADFSFDWEPTVYALNDGRTEAFALLAPTFYGAGDEDTEYEVRGIYTFADTGEQRATTMTFDGTLVYRGLLSFTNKDGTGAPRAMTPSQGDTFTIIEDRYELDADGEWIVNEYPGDTLIFGDSPFVVTAYDSYPGEYSLGIIVSDLQDATVAEYVTVNVTK